MTTTEVLQYKRALSVKLHSPHNVIVQAYKEMTVVKYTLMSARGNIDTLQTHVTSSQSKLVQW